MKVRTIDFELKAILIGILSELILVFPIVMLFMQVDWEFNLATIVSLVFLGGICVSLVAVFVFSFAVITIDENGIHRKRLTKSTVLHWEDVACFNFYGVLPPVFIFPHVTYTLSATHAHQTTKKPIIDESSFFCSKKKYEQILLLIPSELIKQGKINFKSLSHK